MQPKIVKIFGKVTSAKFRLNLGGPAGGSALERASPPLAGKNSETENIHNCNRMREEFESFEFMNFFAHLRSKT